MHACENLTNKKYTIAIILSSNYQIIFIFSLTPTRKYTNILLSTEYAVYTLNCISDVTDGSGRVRLGLGCLKLESLMLRDMPWRRMTEARGPAAAPSGLAAAPPSARC